MDRQLIRRELAAVALTLAAAFVVGAVALQHTETSLCQDATGPFGPFGTAVRCLLIGAVGIPGALVVAAGALAVALSLFGRLASQRPREWAWLAAGVVALLPIGVGLVIGGEPRTSDASGLWGTLVAHYLRKGLGAAGAWIAFLLAVSALTVVTLRWNPIRLLIGARDAMPAEGLPGAGPARLTVAEQLAPDPDELPAIDPVLAREVLGRDVEAPDAGRPLRDPVPDAVPPERTVRRPRGGKGQGGGTEATAAATLPEPVEIAYGDELPPVDLLAPPVPQDLDAGQRELQAAGEKLLTALRTHKLDGTLVGRTTGPSVTQFEIEPAAGVKVRQIAALADDLAMAMRAPSIRIIAPIPGRGAVGVEVPNPVPSMVVLREVLDVPEFRQARAALPIALGKDLEGRPVVADLAKMPHLLIAGATGSGKSVCVNTIITSLVYRHTPRTLRFLMVDPKMVELSVYNALPHLRHRVITDNRDAAAVLKWAVMEMQDRYRLLEANACRNLQEFNKRVTQHEAGEGPALQRPRTPDVAFEDRTYTGGILPYLVVVIDEMADLMMTVQAEVETPIAMLAQKARAIGIHLILATQRPSVNVITGLIKANFPCRIAFRVASQVDSRTIIDGAGAEALLGNGDMLFVPPGKSDSTRVQGAYLASEETERLLGWFGDRRAQRQAELDSAGMMDAMEPDVLEQVRRREAEAAGDDGDDEAGDPHERDTRFREAAEVVIQHRQGSTSLLQRRLKIGYGRAARIIDQLEAAGVLSPSEGPSRPREVLVGVQDLDRICGEGG